MRDKLWGGVALLTLALTGAAQAQEAAPAVAEPAEARVAYDAGYYAQFTPRTALDMIRQTPGFTLIEGAERRGFAGAVGNVLIDGERPAAKGQTLGDILGRIPAAQVVRIEILRGAETAGDASGQPVLANVVRTPSAGDGVWSLGAEYAGQHQAAPNGWGAWSGRVGTTDYSLGASSYSLLREQSGVRDVRDGAGALVGERTEDSPREFYEIGVNGEASRNAWGGRARVTGRVSYERYHQDETVVTFAPAGPRIEDELNPYTEHERAFELGVNYDRAFGAWEGSLIGLVTRTHFESDVSSTHRNASAAVDSIFQQAIARDSGESILRATFERTFAGQRRLEFGLEGAVNTLDQSLALTFDFGGGPFPIPVPNSNLSVEEGRAEAFAAYSQPLGRRWSLEARLAGEASRLSFSGDAEQATELAYIKPSLQLTRAFGARNELRLRLYRDVSQLDFDDFVSSASLSDDIIEGGNPDLRPETSWRAEIAGDFRFGEQAAFGLTLFHYWLDDALDLAPAGPPGERVDAPSNIGEGELSGATLTLRAPLAPLMPGGSFTLDATLREAEVADPLTGARRTISDFEETQLKAGFRQDLNAWRFSWGVNYQGEAERVFHRLAEIDTRRDAPVLDVFVSTRAIPGLSLTLTFVSVSDERELRERISFSGDRTEPVASIETTVRDPGQWLLFSVSGAF